MTTESQQQETQTNNDEISLKELILKLGEWYKYLLSKWKLIVLCGIIGGLAGFGYAYTKKPIYTATTTFVLEDQKGGGGGSLAGLASLAGVDVGSGGGGIFQGDNILELYKSRRMVEKTLLTEVESENGGKRELLIDRYIQFNKLRKAWEKKAELKNLNFAVEKSSLSPKQLRVRDSVMGAIVTNITKNYLTVAKPDKKLSLIKADVKAGDEYFAKVFNELIVKTVNDFYVQTKTKKASENVAILQHKTDSVRAVMNGAIFSAAAVADATPNLNPTRQIQRLAPVQRSQFNAETNKSILSSLVQNLEMAKVTLAKESPLIQVVDEPVYPLQKEKFGKLKGLVLGGILFGFLATLFLIAKKLFSGILSD